MNKDSDIVQCVDIEDDLFYTKRPGVEAPATDNGFPSPVGPSILGHGCLSLGVSRGKVSGMGGEELLKQSPLAEGL